jgi:hypothetical protein
MLEHTHVEVACDADVERVAAARHDVCEIAVILHRWHPNLLNAALAVTRDAKNNRRSFAALRMTAAFLAVGESPPMGKLGKKQPQMLRCAQHDSVFEFDCSGSPPMRRLRFGPSQQGLKPSRFIGRFRHD